MTGPEAGPGWSCAVERTGEAQRFSVGRGSLRHGSAKGPASEAAVQGASTVAPPTSVHARFVPRGVARKREGPRLEGPGGECRQQEQRHQIRQ